MRKVIYNGNLSHNAAQYEVAVLAHGKVVKVFAPDYLVNIERLAKAYCIHLYSKFSIVCQNGYTVVYDYSAEHEQYFDRYKRLEAKLQSEVGAYVDISMPSNGIFHVERNGIIKLFGVTRYGKKVIGEGSTFDAACMALFSKGRI